MPFFRYKAKDQSGKTVSEAAEASSEADLSQNLRSAGLAVLEIQRVSARSAAATGLAPAWSPAWLLPMTSFDVQLAFRQMASMLRSGVSILFALKMASEQARRPRAARIWRGVEAAVTRGERFAAALAASGGPFSEYVVQLATVGEQSGELGIALDRAADHLERLHDLRATVINAMLYPAIAVLAAIAVSAYLVIAVLPKLETFLASGGAELPATTQSLMDVSAFLRTNAVAILLGLAVALLALWAVRKTRRGRLFTDGAILRFPLAGGISRTSGTAVFSRGLSTMLESGVSLLDALRSCAPLLRNRVQRQVVSEAREEVMRGGSLANALDRPRVFRPMLSRMTAVAESTGMLGPTLGEVAEFHDKELFRSVRRLSTLLEPFALAITAGLVGFVYIAFFLAIFQLSGMV